MPFWMRSVYRWILKYKTKVSDIGMSDTIVIPGNLIGKIDGAITLQEYINGLQNE